MDNKAFYKLSYGVFLLGASADGRDNACITNTCIQVASNPTRIAIAVINTNFTCDLVKKAGRFAISNSAHGTTMAFLTMSMTEIFHSFNMRSQKNSIFGLGSQNRTLVIAGIVSLIATTLVCELPFLAAAFDLTSVGFTEYIIAIALGACIIPLVELVKWIKRKNP